MQAQSLNKTTNPWRIELLGGLRVQHGAQILDHFTARKSSSLLACLAFYMDRSHPREELMELLWPDEGPESTRLRFRQVLTTLRRDLDPSGREIDDLLLANRNDVRLNASLVTTDVGEFEAELRAAGKIEKAAERANLLRTAIEQYHGSLLPGYYDEWVAQERQRLADEYVDALRRLAEALAESGDLDQAIEYARKAVAADPVREESSIDLIRLLSAAGRITDALRQFRVLEQALWKELRIVPSDAARELVDSIRLRGSATGESSHQKPEQLEICQTLGDASAPKESVRDLSATSLPAPLTRFFGRVEEISDLVESISPSLHGARLVTLTGPGGSGKTRLSLEVARLLCRDLGGAIWFVPLGELDDPKQLARAIADAVCSNHPAGDPIEQLIETIENRTCLVVLDNFEHLADDAATIVRALLERLPGLRCMITSRQRLNIEGEEVFSVQPLPTPVVSDDLEELRENPSVRLFVDRAQSAQRDFELTKENAHSVVALCRHLEGIPLAIELAAAWSSSLSPSQMLDRMSNRFELLVSRRKDLDDRRRSLWDTISWSYQQLAPELRELFARLSVFHGSYSLEAAESISAEYRVPSTESDPHRTTGDSGLNTQYPLLSSNDSVLGTRYPVLNTQHSTLDRLDQLCERSLIVPDRSGEEIRFRMMETLREFAAATISPEEAVRLRASHAKYFLAIAEQARDELVGPEQRAWLSRLEADHDNLRAVISWSTSDEGEVDLGLRLFGGAWRYLDMRGHVAEAEHWWTRLETKAEDGRLASPSAWAKGLEGAGSLAINQDRDEIGQHRMRRCLDLYRSLDDRLGTERAMYWLAASIRDLGNIELARKMFEESLAISRELGNLDDTARGLSGLGGCARSENDASLAHGYLDQAAALFRIHGNQRGVAWCLHTRGLVAKEQGNDREARTYLEDSLALYRSLDDKLWILHTLNQLTDLAQPGKEAASRNYCAEAIALAKSIGHPEWERWFEARQIQLGIGIAE